jgi:hypothetical protein
VIQLLFNLVMFLGLAMLVGVTAGRESGLMAIPLTLLAGVYSFLVFMRIRVIRWNRRFAKGLCAYCGYDLRATENECPECGAKPENGTRRELARWIELEAESAATAGGEGLKKYRMWNVE